MAERIIGRESLLGLGVLGASGLASAAALILLASNRLPGLDAPQVSAMLLAMQWHLVGLTLAKFGMDYALFAIVSRHRDATLRLRSVLSFPVFPMLGAFLGASLFLFTPLQAALLALAAFADTMSVFRQAEFNAKRAFVTSAIGTFLNYPLFVLAWACAALLAAPSLTQGLAAFAFSSMVRWAWCSVRHPSISRDSRGVALTAKGLIGAQGALNLLLFRADQISLAVLLFLGMGALAANAELSAYLFLARVPELATGGLVLAGAVFFPLRHLEPAGGNSRRALGFYAALAALAAVAGALAALALAPAFAGPDLTFVLAVPFIAQIPLILLANLAVYSMQSQRYLPALIRNLAIACALGLLVVCAAIASGALWMLAWTVPAQLLVFFVLALAVPWGRPIAMFEEAQVA